MKTLWLSHNVDILFHDEKEDSCPSRNNSDSYHSPSMIHECIHCDAKNKVLQENVGHVFFPPHPQITSTTLHSTAIDSERIYHNFSITYIVSETR